MAVATALVLMATTVSAKTVNLIKEYGVKSTEDRDHGLVLKPASQLFGNGNILFAQHDSHSSHASHASHSSHASHYSSIA